MLVPKAVKPPLEGSKTTVAEPVPPVVDQVGHTKAEAVEDFHEIHLVFEGVGRLETVHEAQAPSPAVLGDVLGSTDVSSARRGHVVQCEIVSQAPERGACALSRHRDGLATHRHAVVTVLVDAVAPVDVWNRSHEHRASQAVDDRGAIVQPPSTKLRRVVEPPIVWNVHATPASVPEQHPAP